MDVYADQALCCHLDVSGGPGREVVSVTGYTVVTRCGGFAALLVLRHLCGAKRTWQDGEAYHSCVHGDVHDFVRTMFRTMEGREEYFQSIKELRDILHAVESQVFLHRGRLRCGQSCNRVRSTRDNDQGRIVTFSLESSWHP